MDRFVQLDRQLYKQRSELYRWIYSWIDRYIDSWVDRHINRWMDIFVQLDRQFYRSEILCGVTLGLYIQYGHF